MSDSECFRSSLCRVAANLKAARIVTLWRPAVVNFDQADAQAVV